MNTLNNLIQSEIADFFAGFGSPGEPDIQSGEAQRQLTERVLDLLRKEREAAVPVAMRWRWKDDGLNEVQDWIYHDPKYFEELNKSDTRVCELVYAAPSAQPVAVDEIAEQQGVDPKVTDAYMQGWHDHAAQTVAVPDLLIAKLLEIAKNAADEADKCAFFEHNDESERHSKAIADWQLRAAMLNQPASIQASNGEGACAEIKQPALNSPVIPDGLVQAMQEAISQLDRQAGRIGHGYPQHCHTSPHVWDQGNRVIGHEPCTVCNLWDEMRAFLSAAPGKEG